MRLRMTRRRTIVVAVLVVFLAPAVYLLRPRPVYDYIASTVGLVVSPDGNPLEGVRVTLQSQDVLYEAITPLRNASTVTNGEGRFSFLFISCGTPPGPYRMIFEKPGLETVHVAGRESRKHRVVMQPAVPASIAPAKQASD